MDILHAHVCTVYLCVPPAHGGQKRALRPPGNAVIDSCELPFGCWESNPGLLEEQETISHHPCPSFGFQKKTKFGLSISTCSIKTLSEKAAL